MTQRVTLKKCATPKRYAVRYGTTTSWDLIGWVEETVHGWSISDSDGWTAERLSPTRRDAVSRIVKASRFTR